MIPGSRSSVLLNLHYLIFMPYQNKRNNYQLTELRYKVLLRDLRREPLLHLEQAAELAPGDVVASFFYHQRGSNIQS